MKLITWTIGMIKTIIVIIAMVTIFSSSYKALAADLTTNDLNCEDRATLKAWVSNFESKYKAKEISKENLKSLYMGDSKQAQLLTLYYPQAFKDKVLMGNLAVDCHNNFLKILNEKKKNKSYKIFKRLWRNCVKNMYEGRANILVEKAIQCIER